ncbi:gamma-glutamylcyclotransferase [Polaromonas sp. A23]|uniref:gamma-glutamylcyclotransferase family protein n=1 Tax=Polaromonas sp. A23 TaxID=1944133 RepID=UPI000985579D|nr:gamma-glutamylcyclotransferase family protein [Polaromonas sp. A23]OOG35908.1 gamma-glutamylcyclotransferase [Polaromonas sp. A23]
MPEPTPPFSFRHVFVYGTLRRGDVRDITRLRPEPRFIGMASVAGALYDLGPYPGVVLGGPGRVVGEVYAISPDLESQLDAIEEVWPQQTGEYSKRQVSAVLNEAAAPGGEMALQCLVYEINPLRTAGKRLIASGDWLDGRLGQG